MPHGSLKIVPGVDTNKTPTLNEAGVSASNFIRFIYDRNGYGLAQKIGGWFKYVLNTSFNGVVRNLHAWEDLEATKWLAIGTDGSGSNLLAYDTITKADPLDISPLYSQETITPDGTNYGISTNADENILTVFSPLNHTTNDYVYFPVYLSVGNLLVYGLHKIVNTGSGYYEINFASRKEILTISRNASNVVTVQFAYPHGLSVGQSVYVYGVSDSTNFPDVTSFASAYAITAVTTNSITYSDAGSAAQSSGGYITVAIEKGGVPPQFSISADSSTVIVTLNNHNFSVGDTFNVFHSTNVGSVTLYGLYTINSVSGANSFTIDSGVVNTIGSSGGIYSSCGIDNYPTTSSSGTGTTATLGYTATGKATTATSGTGTAATILFSGSTVIPVNNVVTISGVTPSGYNGTYTITSSSPGSITFACTETGSQTVAGTIYVHLPVGSQISVNGITPTGYRGSYVVTASTYNTVSFASTTTGSQTVAGTIEEVCLAEQFYIAEGTSSGGSTSIYSSGIYGAGLYSTGIVPVGVSGSPILAQDWSLDNWGQILIANPQNGSLFYWLPVGSAVKNALIIPNSPIYNTGSFVAMPQRQIIAYGSSFTNYQDTLLIRWCDVEDFSVWVGTATNQAGSFRIPTGSKIVSALQANQQAYIWTDVDVWSMQYIGPPLVYGFNKLGTNCGAISQKSTCNISGITYWMGSNQFFTMSGSGPTPLPCPIRDQIFDNIYPGSERKIRAGSNSHFNEIVWYYPAARVPIQDESGIYTGEYAAGNGEVNAYIKYNIILQQWDFGYQDLDFYDDGNVLLARTAWIDATILGNPVCAATFSSIPGQPVSSVIYQQEETYNADGIKIKPFFQTGNFAIAEGDNKIFIDQIWPDMKWGTVGDEIYVVSGTSGTGSVATLTIEKSVKIPVGTEITVSGVVPSGYNGTHIVTASTNGTVSFSNSTTGSITTPGTLSLSNFGTVKMTFYLSNYPTDTPVKYGPYDLTREKQYLSVRMRGRLLSISISSEDFNSEWRLGNIRYRYAPDGKY